MGMAGGSFGFSCRLIEVSPTMRHKFGAGRILDFLPDSRRQSSDFEHRWFRRFFLAGKLVLVVSGLFGRDRPKEPASF